MTVTSPKKVCPFLMRGLCVSAECELFNEHESECCLKTIGHEFSSYNNGMEKLYYQIKKIADIQEKDLIYREYDVQR